MRGKGKPFKPGNSFGKGRPKLPDDLAGVQKLTPDIVQRIFAKFAMMTSVEMQAALKNPEATMIEIMVGSVVAKAAKEGDQSRFNFLLDRMVGKVKDVVEHQGADLDDELDRVPRSKIIELMKGG